MLLEAQRCARLRQHRAPGGEWGSFKRCLPLEQHRGDHQELLIRNCPKNNLGTAITVGQRAAAPPALWGREAGKEEGKERGRKKRCPRSGPEPGSEGEKRTLCPAMGSARPAPRYLPERPLVPALREPGVPARRQIGAEAPEAAELPALAGGGVPRLQHPGGTRRQPREEQQQQQRAQPGPATA